MKHVRIWAYDGVMASGIAGPIDVFSAANGLSAALGQDRRTASLPFEWRVESLDGKPVRSAAGQIVNVDGQINARTSADVVILTAPFVNDIAHFLDHTPQLEPLYAALRKQHDRGALIATYCSGSFLLAQAGLLDGRIATTHWAKSRSFEKRFPEVELLATEIITEQDGIFCSGAVTTYLNLALRLVEKLAGSRLATETAKTLLIDMNRISQASYTSMARQGEEEHTDDLVARSQQWMQKHIRQGFSLPDLATHLSVSERTINRRFKNAIGESPLRYLQTLRVQVAKVLLETTRLSVDDVCERVGYADVSTFRQLFKREAGVAPGEYQRRFARPGRN